MTDGGGVRKGQWYEILSGNRLLDTPERMEHFLLKELRIPPALYRSWKEDGGIQKAGDRLRLRLFPVRETSFPPEWMDLDVLYEDDFCLAVNKPSGIKVHPADKGEGGTLANYVAGYFEATGQQAAVRHIHRLDEYTSGPVLYAKNEFAQYVLDEAMRDKKIERIYMAVASGRMKPDSGKLDFPIGRDRHHGRRYRVSAGGKPAVTLYRVIEQYGEAALLELQLETGRTHQVRVHLSHIGHPLWGDILYGGPSEGLARQALHGAQLRFPHPFSRRLIAVEAPLPADLQALIRQLKNHKL
ncbi:RluA family pseudouridine synthase [Ferviditalea candida]|uniref:Pseudouridine synthase n=1 Tax=Ferviditalea candida TaxID=3108399 RepID=A0ABU5ZD10_9BACL|nr:RluA family pseudouridine synthase [Paenibacillaceae bacterium T2]